MQIDLKAHTRKRVKGVLNRNKKNTDEYKKKLKEQIRTNIVDKGQSVKANQGIIDRFYNATPKPLTQMQQALLEASV
jgi:hypothetical protein